MLSGLSRGDLMQLDTQAFKLSVVIPVYNEADTLYEMVGRVVRAPLRRN